MQLRLKYASTVNSAADGGFSILPAFLAALGENASLLPVTPFHSEARSQLFISSNNYLKAYTK